MPPLLRVQWFLLSTTAMGMILGHTESTRQPQLTWRKRACVVACNYPVGTPTLDFNHCDEKLFSGQISTNFSDHFQDTARRCLTPCDGLSNQYDQSFICRAMQNMARLPCGNCPTVLKVFKFKDVRMPKSLWNKSVDLSYPRRFPLAEQILDYLRYLLIYEELHVRSRFFYDNGTTTSTSEIVDISSTTLNNTSVESTTTEIPTTFTPSTTTNDPNWENWCMIQCQNGHGGSACNCDIIP